MSGEKKAWWVLLDKLVCLRAPTVPFFSTSMGRFAHPNPLSYILPAPNYGSLGVSCYYAREEKTALASHRETRLSFTEPGQEESSGGESK